MSRNNFQNFIQRVQIVVVVTAMGRALHCKAAEPPTASTNTPSVTVGALVAEVLEHNPELNFYRAEISAARGERRTAATLANPDLSTTVGEKHVAVGPVTSDGLAWSVS